MQFRMQRSIWWQDVYHFSDLGKEFMPLYLNKIRTAVAAERILEFKVQDGWTPLCKFLNKDIPTEDFPHRKKFEELSAGRNVLRRQALATWFKWFKEVAITIVILVIVYLVCWRGLVSFQKI